MKKNLFYLFVLICTVSMFSSCDKDDDIEYIGTEFDGVYKGTLDVNVGEPLNVDVKDIPQKIYITKVGENRIKLQLKNFSFQSVPVGDIEVTDIPVIKSGSNCTFNGSSDLNLDLGKCNVTIDGNIEGENTNIKIGVKVLDGTFKDLLVDVNFDGKKLAADQSSEAKILTFTFDSELVTSQPVIDGTNITFMVTDTINAEQLAALVPTITISANATINPASGVAQNFAAPVTYTVTSEDGIITTKYTVSVAGKEKFYEFEEWDIVKSSSTGSSEQYETPTGLFGTSNPGALTINDMANQVGQNFGYPVVPTDGKNGKGVMIKSLHTAIVTADGQDFNALLGGLLPYITAGSLYTGTFKLNMFDALSSTKFGVAHNGKPVTFTGWYKYTPGNEYRDKKNNIVEGEVDKCAINAVLYEEELDKNGENVPLTGHDINTSDRVVMRASLQDTGAKSEWTEFTLPFESMNGKEYDSSKKYYLAIICSSSYKGDAYEGAPGSTLIIDSFKVVSE